MSENPMVKWFGDLSFTNGLDINHGRDISGGDNISTKIGSSWVEIEIGEASPIFQEIEIGIGEALVKSRVGSGASGF